jgi:hypothetical protein
MRSKARNVLRVCCVASAFAAGACGTGGTAGLSDATNTYAVTRCDGSPVVHAAASAQPHSAPAAVYVGTGGFVGGGSGNTSIVALATGDGALRWCAGFALTKTYACPPGARCPRSPSATVGTPLVADGGRLRLRLGGTHWRHVRLRCG